MDTEHSTVNGHLKMCDWRGTGFNKQNKVSVQQTDS